MSNIAQILKSLRVHNKKLARADRAELWKDVEEVCGMKKQTFNKIITGQYCSDANQMYAEVFLQRMKAAIEARKQQVKELKKRQ